MVQLVSIRHVVLQLPCTRLLLSSPGLIKVKKSLVKVTKQSVYLAVFARLIISSYSSLQPIDWPVSLNIIHLTNGTKTLLFKKKSIMLYKITI